MKYMIIVAVVLAIIFLLAGFVGKMVNSAATYMDDSFRWGGGNDE